MNEQAKRRAFEAARNRYQDFPDIFQASIGWLLMNGTGKNKEDAERILRTYGMPPEEVGVMSILSARSFDTGDQFHSHPMAQAGIKSEGLLAATGSKGPKSNRRQ